MTTITTTYTDFLTDPSSGRQARGTRTGRFRNVQGPWPDTTPEADGASVRRL